VVLKCWSGLVEVEVVVGWKSLVSVDEEERERSARKWREEEEYK
jgi:hypothetical protein